MTANEVRDLLAAGETAAVEAAVARACGYEYDADVMLPDRWLNSEKGKQLPPLPGWLSGGWEYIGEMIEALAANIILAAPWECEASVLRDIAAHLPDALTIPATLALLMAEAGLLREGSE